MKYQPGDEVEYTRNGCRFRCGTVGADGRVEVEGIVWSRIGVSIGDEVSQHTWGALSAEKKARLRSKESRFLLDKLLPLKAYDLTEKLWEDPPDGPVICITYWRKVTPEHAVKIFTQGTWSFEEHS